MPAGMYAYTGNKDPGDTTDALRLNSGLIPLGGWGSFTAAEFDYFDAHFYLVPAGSEQATDAEVAAAIAAAIAPVNANVAANTAAIAQRVRKDSAVEQTIISRLNVNAPTGIALNLDGDIDGQNGANTNPYRVGFGSSMINGANGGRGGSPNAINVDAANGAGSSFFAPYYQNATMATKGSVTQYTGYLTVNETATGGEYGEGFSFYGNVVTNRRGALTGALEGKNTVNAGKQARASAANLILTEANAPPTYNGFSRSAEGAYTAAIFGATSEWLKGSRVVDVVSDGAQPAGVGINFRGQFARPILFEPDANHGFAVSSTGFLDVLQAGAADYAFRAFRADTGKTIPSAYILANGKIGASFGTSGVNVFLEPTAGGVWKVSNALQLTAIAAAAVPNNTIFLDAADNVIKRKDNSGAVAAI